jgi:hypothetical protein
VRRFECWAGRLCHREKKKVSVLSVIDPKRDVTGGAVRVPSLGALPVGRVDMFFVRVNQVLVRRWTCLVAMSDRWTPLALTRLALTRGGSPATRSGARTFGSARFGPRAQGLRAMGRDGRALLCAELRCVARRGGVICMRRASVGCGWLLCMVGFFRVREGAGEA